MKNLYIYITALFVLLSCTAEYGPHNSAGSISVQIAAEYASAPQTKAPVMLDSQQAASFSIGVYNADGTRAEYNDGTGEIPETFLKDFKAVEVALGRSYYVTAASCSESDAEIGKGCPRYEGASDVFALNASNISQTAEIVCYQTNALVTVKFDEAVAGRFDGLKVELKSDSNPDRILTILESDGTQNLYFNPSKVSYKVTGTYKGTDHIATTSVSFEGSRVLAAKDNVCLHVKINLDYGLATAPAISVIEEMDEEVDVENVIDPYAYEN